MKNWSEEAYKILKLVAVVLSILVVVLPVWYILATTVDQQNSLIFMVFILVTSILSSMSWFVLIFEYFNSLESGSIIISSGTFIMFGIFFFFLGFIVLALDIYFMIRFL